MASWRKGYASERNGPVGAVQRVVVHDFSGHPFQAQLARHLAGQSGLEVTHLYCASFQTPHGDIGGADAATGYRSNGIVLRRHVAKYSPIRRAVQELEYGVRLWRRIRSARPDVVISANTPLVAAVVVHVALKLSQIPVIFWLQDIYSEAIGAHLLRKGGRIRRLVVGILTRAERFVVRSSAYTVVISADFRPVLEAWGVAPDRVEVIENWAPLEEVSMVGRPNEWSERQGIQRGDRVLLYAGTLGLKHQPSLLLDLAAAFAGDPRVRVIVASEGIGAKWLGEHRASNAALVSRPEALTLLPFQPYDQLPNMLAAADVLLVLLEPHAGVYSVPSKVLTYHCAGRPILGAVPANNLAGQTIIANGSGVVVEPGDSMAFVDAARQLLSDDEAREEMGRAARAYAERTFDIDSITARFRELVDRAAAGRRR